jgi:DMSO/TMAO reductase YedYZ molybdopterin-dependent catalytic subunit
MTEATTPGLERPPLSRAAPIGAAALAGAVAAGLALGLTELLAGFFERIPSAVSAVGTYVVDGSPSFVKDFAISVFGTADKGALAIGTVVFGVIIGALVGRAGLRRPWLSAVAFGGFALLGIVAAAGQVDANLPMTIVGISLAAGIGWLSLRFLLAALNSADPLDHTPANPDRRKLIGGMAGAGLLAAAAGGVGRQMIIARSESVRDRMALPRARTTVASPGAASSLDVPGISPIVVPTKDFYRIDTALVVPRPDPASWRLGITGMVDRELSLSMDDLLAMDLHERYVTIACVSNRVGGDLVGNAKWTGVKLTEVLDRAGVDPAAGQIVPRSVDGWTAGFPTAAAFDGREPLIALGMNDEMLPPAHGFPARLIVPGLYGYVSATKWLEEIELTSWEAFDAYWIPRGWAKEGPIKTQSRIDTPGSGSIVEPAFVVAGVAWSPQHGIEKVEVRVDGGPWVDAEMSLPLADTAWVQWQANLAVAAGRHEIEVRATDGTGQPQTEQQVAPRPDGASGYHKIAVTTG